jgi:hypothetical protein
LECIAPSASGADQTNVLSDVIVKVLGISTKVGTYTYQPPEVQSIHPTSGPARGGTQFTLSGNHLQGTAALQPSVTLATQDGVKTMCKIVQATQRSIRCVTEDHETSGVATVIVSVDTIQSSPSPATSYEFLAPSATSVSPAVLPTYGSTPIVVTGKFFGLEQYVSFVCCLLCSAFFFLLILFFIFFFPGNSTPKTLC